jgi:hypothetical protein
MSHQELLYLLERVRARNRTGGSFVCWKDDYKNFHMIQQLQADGLVKCVHDHRNETRWEAL